GGQGTAAPQAPVLSAAMVLRHSFGRDDHAARIERAVAQALADGVRSADLDGSDNCEAIGAAVRDKL
ncbi:MAG TPA: 3-isopropylmalate dehydrogenase, partial [Erythrobacter sp.]|nr:3-isopropylmalate dehydrogenase [Erythrobacter sp.]